MDQAEDRKVTGRAISAGDALCLARVFGKLHPDLVAYVWSRNGDDFMLRVELLGLRDRIEEILKRSERDNAHRPGLM